MSKDFQAASTASHARVAAKTAAAAEAAAGQKASASQDQTVHEVSSATAKSAPFARHMARINRLRTFVLVLGIALALLGDFVAAWASAAYVALVVVMVMAWAVGRFGGADSTLAKAEG